MKLRIYIIGGAIISGEISEEGKYKLDLWFKGEGESTFNLHDGNIERVLNRNCIALIEYTNL